MDTWLIVLLITLAVLLLGGLVAMFAYTYPISKQVYRRQLVRTDKEKWGRTCSAPENQEQLAMWNAGMEWANRNRDHCTPVHLQNDGFNLFGEYYDFGSDRCVIVLPGRCESLCYSYYFAPPYQAAGINVLVIDTRCHGQSDGTHNTIGVQESRDVLAWAQYLHTQYGIAEIWLHGICIGTSSGLFALTAPDCPAYLRGLVTEGCYISFRETFKRHMIADKRPLFPVLDLVMWQIRRHTGTNVYRQKPLSAVKKLPPHLRVLFLNGKQDIFSIPSKTQKLFDACAVTDKKLIWFDRGGHSHLRINNTQAYDAAIIDFVGRA